MKLVAVSALCLWGLLCLSVNVKAGMFEVMRDAAASWTGSLPCGNWDCECAFTRQRGCCCASNQMNDIEEQTFTRMVHIWGQLKMLDNDIQEVTGNSKFAFTAAMGARSSCFGPFTSNVPIPYNSISLNQGNGYNPALGTFTAPRAGLYSFSFSAYSNVGKAGKRLYHKVQLMKNGEVVASMWEDNREDMEDSGTQVVLLTLRQGCQVYVELLSGRMLCGNTEEFNIFTGYLLYPFTEE